MTGEHILLGIAAIPSVYYLLALYSAARFFRVSRRENVRNTDFLPPVSCLKPIKGLDEGAYENYASFCRQDYPEYEIVFCLDSNDPAVPVIEKLIRDFPERRIRMLFGSGRVAINDKVARMTRLTNEAQYDIFSITDGDVRVGPDYLRAVAAAFRDPNVGAATCLYISTTEENFVESLQSISMTSDFFAGILVAWQLDGVKFTLGQSILATRKAIESFGGYPVLENRPGDDLYTGRLIAEHGFDTKLLPYVVQVVPDYGSLRDLIHKRLRWITGMRLMRPWGHFGLLFTWGLPWALFAVAVHPAVGIAAAYVGTYLAMRVAMTWLIGVPIMKQAGIWKRMALVPVWDALAFALWLASFGRKTLRWRGIDYYVRDGRFVNAKPVEPSLSNE